MRRQRTST